MPFSAERADLTPALIDAGAGEHHHRAEGDGREARHRGFELRTGSSGRNTATTSTTKPPNQSENAEVTEVGHDGAGNLEAGARVPREREGREETETQRPRDRGAQRAERRAPYQRAAEAEDDEEHDEPQHHDVPDVRIEVVAHDRRFDGIGETEARGVARLDEDGGDRAVKATIHEPSIMRVTTRTRRPRGQHNTTNPNAPSSRPVAANSTNRSVPLITPTTRLPPCCERRRLASDCAFVFVAEASPTENVNPFCTG